MLFHPLKEFTSSSFKCFYVSIKKSRRRFIVRVLAVDTIAAVAPIAAYRNCFAWRYRVVLSVR